MSFIYIKYNQVKPAIIVFHFCYIQVYVRHFTLAVTVLSIFHTLNTDSCMSRFDIKHFAVSKSSPVRLLILVFVGTRVVTARYSNYFGYQPGHCEAIVMFAGTSMVMIVFAGTSMVTAR
jgi:hypothetical protein